MDFAILNCIIYNYVMRSAWGQISIKQSKVPGQSNLRPTHTIVVDHTTDIVNYFMSCSTIVVSNRNISDHLDSKKSVSFTFGTNCQKKGSSYIFIAPKTQFEALGSKISPMIEINTLWVYIGDTVSGCNTLGFKSLFNNFVAILTPVPYTCRSDCRQS